MVSNALFGICESVFVIEDGSFLYLEELSLHLFMNQSLPVLAAAKQIGWGKNNPVIFLMFLGKLFELKIWASLISFVVLKVGENSVGKNSKLCNSLSHHSI